MRRDLGFDEMTDLFNLTSDIIAKFGGNQLLTGFRHNIRRILAFAYPSENWYRQTFPTTKQELVHSTILSLYPTSSTLLFFFTTTC